MSAFKDDLYRDYVATHLLPRKSAPTIEAFEAEGRTWRRQFTGWLPADTRVPILDVGCGWGKLLWWMQHEGYAAAEGIDVNAEVIEIGQRLGVQRLHQADARACSRRGRITTRSSSCATCWSISRVKTS